MPNIYPIHVQLVERTLQKLIDMFPPFDNVLKLLRTLREESNYFRYGTFKLSLTNITVEPQSSIDLPGINIPGLRAGMELHMTPPLAFYAAYPDVTWNCECLTDSYAPDPTQYDPTTTVTLRLHNATAAPIIVTSVDYWQYLGVISRSLNGTDPDTGQQVPTGGTFIGD